MPLQFRIPGHVAKDIGFDKKCVIKDAKTALISHDNLFHPVLSLPDIETSEYRPDPDAFKNCRIKAQPKIPLKADPAS